MEQEVYRGGTTVTLKPLPKLNTSLTSFDRILNNDYAF